jgi:hypothetical protein
MNDEGTKKMSEMHGELGWHHVMWLRGGTSLDVQRRPGACRSSWKPDKRMMMKVTTMAAKAGWATYDERDPEQPAHVQPT